MSYALWQRFRGAVWLLFNGGRRQNRLRRERFYLLTGLHGCYVEGRGYLPDDEVIAVQARTIKGLQTQLSQQSRGCQRKITKLTRLLSAERAKSVAADATARNRTRAALELLHIQLGNMAFNLSQPSCPLEREATVNSLTSMEHLAKRGLGAPAPAEAETEAEQARA